MKNAIGVILAASVVVSAGAAELAHFERMLFNNPGLEVDLSLGIWPHANVYDYDGDGRLDLLLRAAGAPMKGSQRTPLCRVYRDFMNAVPMGDDVPRSAWDTPKKTDGVLRPRLLV